MPGSGLAALPLQYATGIVTYYQFILEETIQSGLMGCYIGNKYGHISLMDKVIERLNSTTIPALHEYNRGWGYFAYYNKQAFDCFWKAAKVAVWAYKECR
uniref:Uncharacterized protein n=1 Tax=Uncultured archaeon GZfos26G2 TaxID=3386331 RepID=Q648H1_UNCAG|nr:hypothetical protein GZ37D1_53 [uncultured archaeon GZfos37D1]